MRMHIAEGALRVRVLDRAADGRESTAMEIAWHCDLVITTFQRLSVEWSNGRIKAKSIFNQVTAVMKHALGALLPQSTQPCTLSILSRRCNGSHRVAMYDCIKTRFICSLRDAYDVLLKWSFGPCCYEFCFQTSEKALLRSHVSMTRDKACLLRKDEVP